MNLLTGRRLGLLGLVVAVGVAAAGIAYAAIPDNSGVIHGCYKKIKATCGCSQEQREGLYDK